ncbi:hypothetical protein CEQ90_04875 [Lewinellaceae bacterium SD302]|nr:hypothetical protein CEQ90_04875 [Lewinellaceae bacterium SD302]
MQLKKLLPFMAMVVGLLLPLSPAWSHINPANRPANNDEATTQIDFRSNCDNAVSQLEQEINNVRARLTTGGDVWWDGDNGRYVVPKPAPGDDEVSSIFAGAVWLGGRSPSGTLKVSAQQYGRGSGNFDYYPGPLTPEGVTSQDTCSNWDRFFVVSGENIRLFIADYLEALDADALPLDPNDIPEDILGWPALGNPYFFDINGYELPTGFQGLAGFWDEDGNGFYDPTGGDFPIIEIRGCEAGGGSDFEPQFAEEMTFWIYNDAGNIHRESNTPEQIRMEVQVQAFAFTTADDINNMTFQRYKLINRATDDLEDTYFAMWVDPDLGCYEDDYVGCDTVRDLAYIYNEDEQDGSSGTTCAQGVLTYGEEIPILGVDYFRGPLDENGNELGMSSFIYINGAGTNPPPPTTDPNTAPEFYNFLQGIWKDGTPLEFGGDGFDEGSFTTRYAFPDAPEDDEGWSMCAAGLESVDRRTLQASGPFTLTPGAVNELIIGVVWVADQVYPCPSLSRLQQADDIAQDLFDNCFDILEGPDAPDVDWVELDREVIALLSNGRASNNFELGYEEEGFGIQDGADSLYRFEGYRIFQFANSEVRLDQTSINDPSLVRMVGQVDLKNNVTSIFNWNALDPVENQTPTEEIFYTPELQVEGEDQGIRSSFRITEDAFGRDDTRLINHRRYYFAAIAYGYNNWQEFDPETTIGQQMPYLPSSRNIGTDGDGTPYTVIPRPIIDLDLNTEYGSTPQITRLSGKGNLGGELDLTDETVRSIEEELASDTLYRSNLLTYETGTGPFEVKVVDPRNIMDGDYQITVEDADLTDDMYSGSVKWVLRCMDDCGVDPIVSDTTIDIISEQIIAEFGFSVTLSNPDEVASNPFNNESNGAISGSVSYADPNGSRWLAFVPDGLALGNPVLSEVFNYVSTESSDAVEFNRDPNQSLTELLPGVAPLALMRNQAPLDATFPVIISPAWQEGSTAANVRQNTDLTRLNNVNIVFTSNKDLWSRCPVIETRTDLFPAPTEVDPNLMENGYSSTAVPAHFDTRAARSVTKEAGADGKPMVQEIDSDVDAILQRGMGWFPGYAIDVETGQRLAIYFGENSVYDGRESGEGINLPDNGADMMFNPSSELITPSEGGNPATSFAAGGQHFVYVTDQPYVDYSLTSFIEPLVPALRTPGGFLWSRLNPGFPKAAVLGSTTWALFPILTEGEELLSYADGLIPNDVTVKLRVDSEFEVAEGVSEFNGHGAYEFSIDGKMSNAKDEAGIERALDMINVVPNPYYANSIYEDNVFDNIVKVTNLPAKATVTIYSLDGKFIRQYNRDETPTMLRGSEGRPIGTRQIAPALEWDLNNFRGVPVASGVYLIHVDAGEMGERTLKLFMVNRQFDPSGL